MKIIEYSQRLNETRALCARLTNDSRLTRRTCNVIAWHEDYGSKAAIADVRKPIRVSLSGMWDMNSYCCALGHNCYFFFSRTLFTIRANRVGLHVYHSSCLYL